MILKILFWWQLVSLVLASGPDAAPVEVHYKTPAAGNWSLCWPIS